MPSGGCVSTATCTSSREGGRRSWGRGRCSRRAGARDGGALVGGSAAPDGGALVGGSAAPDGGALVGGSAAPDGGALAEAVSDRLSALAAEMRTQGARVGLGELLTAHQALGAVDCTSREDARSALRAVLCSARGDLTKFERAFLSVFGEGHVPLGGNPFDELEGIPREVLPHAGIPASAPPPDADADPTAVPAAWRAVELLRHKDFAGYTDLEVAAA